MIISKLKKFIFIHTLIFKKYSILRILQILEIKSLNSVGTVGDVGSKKSSTNVTNYLNIKNKITYLDNYSSDSEVVKINLEEREEEAKLKFDNVFLLNVLEHIYNYKNCLNNCYLILNEKGIFYGSTPFFFRIHLSPNDYFRFTEQSILKSLEDAGFKEVEVKVLNGGIFLCFYNSISTISQKIPLMNNLLYIFCQILDQIIFLFSKNTKKIFPLGYFFKGKK